MSNSAPQAMENPDFLIKNKLEQIVENFKVSFSLLEVRWNLEWFSEKICLLLAARSWMFVHSSNVWNIDDFNETEPHLHEIHPSFSFFTAFLFPINSAFATIYFEQMQDLLN